MHSAEATDQLLRRIRGGERDAEQALYERSLPLLRRWAHGRLPRSRRDVSDTDDLVQVTLLRALKHLPAFKPEGRGSFLAYLRQILLNEVRGELRKLGRRGTAVDIDHADLPDDGDSVVGALVGAERLAVYEQALAGLERRQQELVLLRLEFGMSYAEIAIEVGSTADAVRMSVTRALKTMTAAIAASDP